MAYSIDNRRYWDRKAQQTKADKELTAKVAQNPMIRLDRLYRKLDSLYADKNAHAPAEFAALQAEIDALKAEIGM